MSNYQQGVGPEVYYAFSAAGTALSTFTTEASLMGGYPIPPIPATYFKALGETSSTAKIRATGNVGSTTAAPTMTLTMRLLSSATTWSAGGVLLGSSNAMTVSAVSLTNAWWQLDVDLIMRTIAAGAATSTIATFGTVTGTGLTGFMPANNVSSVASTLDVTGATQYFLWLSAACGTSNAANAISLQGLKIYLEN
jgi:hypothetical protein